MHRALITIADDMYMTSFTIHIYTWHTRPHLQQHAHDIYNGIFTTANIIHIWPYMQKHTWHV